MQVARDLVGAPANYVTPTTLAEAAREIAREAGLSIEARGGGGGRGPGPGLAWRRRGHSRVWRGRPG